MNFARSRRKFSLKRFLIACWDSLAVDKIFLLALLTILIFSLVGQSSLPVRETLSLDLWGNVYTFSGFFVRHLGFILLGMLGFALGASIKTESLRKFSGAIYAATILLLVVVLILGTSSLGAQRWITVAGISLQPSEPVKLAIILVLADRFFQNKPTTLIQVILAGASIVLPPFLLIFAQPDLGTAIVLVAIFTAMAFAAGAQPHQLMIILSPLIVSIGAAIGETAIVMAPIKLLGRTIIPSCSWIGFYTIAAMLVVLMVACRIHRPEGRRAIIWIMLFAGVSLAVALIGRPLAWHMLEPYQQKRLIIFLNPESDPLQSGYNIIQSLKAVGNGQLWGTGYGKGHLTQGKFVPEQHTDFIFSSIAEEWGFVGSVFLLAAYGLLCLRLLHTIHRTEEPFESYLCTGVMSFIGFHVFVNIGMNIGLLPVTGVPLPLMSYGGTSMLVCLFSLGITQRVYIDTHQLTIVKRFVGGSKQKQKSIPAIATALRNG